MEISNNYASIQVLSSKSKSNILSTSEVSKNYQTEMDKLDLSPQSVAISKEVCMSIIRNILQIKVKHI